MNSHLVDRQRNRWHPDIIVKNKINHSSAQKPKINAHFTQNVEVWRLRGGMAPCGTIFHENVNFLFVAQKCEVIDAFHKTHKQNAIALIETHILGDFINNMVFGDQRVSTEKRRW